MHSSWADSFSPMGGGSPRLPKKAWLRKREIKHNGISQIHFPRSSRFSCSFEPNHTHTVRNQRINGPLVGGMALRWLCTRRWRSFWRSRGRGSRPCRSWNWVAGWHGPSSLEINYRRARFVYIFTRKSLLNMFPLTFLMLFFHILIACANSQSSANNHLQQQFGGNIHSIAISLNINDFPPSSCPPKSLIPV